MTDERKGEKADENFKAWFDRTLPFLAKMAGAIVKAGDQHMPMMIVYPNDSVMAQPKILVVPSIRSVADKELIAFAQRNLAAETDMVYAVITIIECWMRMSTPEEQKKYTNLEHAPDKTEGIVFNAIHGRQQLYAVARIDRTTNTLGKPEVHDPMTALHLEGRMILNREEHGKH